MKQAKECAERLFGIADPHRLRILQLLRSGPRNVGQVAAGIGQSLVTTSHHLKIMERHGITEGQRQGRHVVYRLRADVFTKGDCLDFGCCKFRLPA